MIFRQLFDNVSSTYTYLIACENTQQAVIIDPVIENVEQYLTLIDELSLTLLYALDTHVHADHITALGELRNVTGCITMMGKEAQAACISMPIEDGYIIEFGDLSINVLHTPGHTRDSYSYLMKDRIFTGDTLLIRSTGRTDFQAGDAKASWDSITGIIFKLPDDTLIFPGHDYNGFTVSTVLEEKAYNPRLANKTEAEYIKTMNNLNLPSPKLMDIAVPVNKQCGAKLDVNTNYLREVI